MPLSGRRQVIVVADRWDETPEMLRACQALGDSVLIRLTSHRKFSRTPGRRFTRGHPPHDGSLVRGTRLETPLNPSEMWESADQQGKLARVSRLDSVHVQQDLDLILSVIQVERTSAHGTTRDPQVSRFLTLDHVLPVEQMPPRDGLRFSEEHLFRFLTQDVLWLARSAVLPWKATGRPVTPRQSCRPCCCRVAYRSGRATGFRLRLAPHAPVLHPTSIKEKKGTTTFST